MTEQNLATATAGANGREQLLSAASQLMTELGSIDVSLHQIARRAGLTAPLVKYHFGSKDGLLLALAERDTKGSLEQLEELMAMDLDPATKMRIHIHGIIRTYARYPYLNQLLDLLLWDQESESSRSIRMGFMRPLIEAQRKILEDGIASGQFRDVEPEFLYFLVIGTCLYIFSTRVAVHELFGETRVRKELATKYSAFAADTILRGISA
jgi:AcrR family transcriptional regulator